MQRTILLSDYNHPFILPESSLEHLNICNAFGHYF